MTRLARWQKNVRMNRRRAFVGVASSIALVAACSSSSAPIGNEAADSGAATDAAQAADTGARDSGAIVDAGAKDTGPVVTGNFACAGASLPTTAPASITVGGRVVDQSTGGATALSDVAFSAYPTQTSTTASSNATSGGTGAFSIVIGTGGVPVDGYLKATKSGEMDTYLYPNAPLAADASNLAVVMITPDTLTLLQLGASATQDADKGLVAVVVLDCDGNPVQGATVSIGSATIRYDGAAGPSATAAATGADGIAYAFNVPAGDATVSAMAGTVALRTHHLVSRTGVFTTTLVTP